MDGWMLDLCYVTLMQKSSKSKVPDIVYLYQWLCLNEYFEYGLFNNLAKLVYLLIFYNDKQQQDSNLKRW